MIWAVSLKASTQSEMRIKLEEAIDKLQDDIVFCLDSDACSFLAEGVSKNLVLVLLPLNQMDLLSKPKGKK